MAVQAITHCRICGKPIPENRTGAFCSDRCKLLDLGSWADGSYRVPDRTDCGAEGMSTDSDSFEEE